MINYIFHVFILIILLAPISLLIHELGHVYGATRMKATKVQLSIGIGSTLFQRDTNKFEIILRRFFLVHYATATVREEPFRRSEKLFITIMGPLFNAICAFSLFLIEYYVYTHLIIQLFMLFNIWLVVMNLIPFKIGQKHSDGYTIYRLFFQ